MDRARTAPAPDSCYRLRGCSADYQNASGDYIEWTVNASAAGTYALTFRYGLGSSSGRPLELRVNGTVVVASLAFPPTGAWTTWGTVKATVTLQAGSNKVRTTAIGSSGANVDHLSAQRQ